MSNEGSLYFQIRLDNGKLRVDAVESQKIIKGIGDSYQKEGQRMDSISANIAKGIAAAFTLNSAQNFVSQIVKVRGEIQALESSFATLLQSKAKGDAMLAEIRKYAVETPYNLQDISATAQRMLAFNIEAEKILPTIKQLGDIAMGDGQKLQSLALAFAKTSSNGRLMAEELNSMIDAGFNPLVQISDKTGKSVESLKKQMEKGQISVAMVAETFADATSEGGKFFGMMEKQADGIQGNIAGLEDAWISMYNAIGQSNEGVIVDSIKGLTTLVENYETVGRVLAEIVATYGVYKGSLIALEAIQKAHIALSAQWTVVQRAAAISQVSLNSAQIAGTLATRSLQSAWTALNSTMLSNPYVLVAAGITALSFAIYKFTTFTSEAEKAQERLTEAKVDAAEAYNKEAEELDKLFNSLKGTKEGTEQYKKAKDAIMSKYGTQIEMIEGERKKVLTLSEAYTELKDQALAAAQARALQTFSDASADDRNSKFKDLGKGLLQELQRGGKNKNAMADYQAIMQAISAGRNINPQFITQYDKNNLGMGSGPRGTRLRYYIDNLSSAQENYNKEIEILESTFTKAKDLIVAPPDPTKTGSGTKELTQEEIDRAAKEAARLEKLKQEQIRREQAYQEEIARIQREAIMDQSEQRIALMDEGIEKEIAQINANYDRTIYENERRLKEALEKERDIRESAWEADPANQDAIKKGAVFNRNSIGLNDLGVYNPQAFALYQQQIQLATDFRVKATERANTQVELDREKKAREAIDNIATYEYKAREIASKFDMSAIEGRRYNFASDKERDTLFVQLDKATANYNSLTEAQNKTQESLERLQELQRKSPNKKTEQEIKETTAAINGLGLEIQEASAEINDLNIKISKIDNKKIIEGLNNYARIARQFGGLGGEIGTFFNDLADNMEFMSILMDENAKDFDKYAAAAQMAISTINKIISSAQKRKQVEDEFERSKLAFAQSYALALNEQLRLQGELNNNGFVRNYQGEITGAFNAMAQAATEYAKSLDALEDGEVKTGTKRKVNWGSVGSGALAGAAYGSNAGPWGAAIGAVVGGVVGLFSGMKRVDVYKDLLSVYPGLIDAEGELNEKMAESLLASGLLNEQTKLLVQNALDWKDAIDAAKEQISGIVGELAGALGNDLQGALIEAWKAGEDASERMFAAANKSLANFVQNFLYSTIFSGIFDKFKERLTKALDPNGGGEDILDIYDDLMSEALIGGETFNKALEEFKKRAAERGFDISDLDGGTRSGANKGFAAMSQDTGEELNGRFTAIQGHTYSLMNSAIEIKGILEADRARAAQSLLHLANIDTNTSRLAAIETHITRMSNNIETISERGVKML
jgi:tape measure domain-containing protein